MSDRSGIDNQKIKRTGCALMFCLFAGCFVSRSCFASTNEDLTAPPPSEMAVPVQLQPKPQETKVIPSKPESDAQKQPEPKTSTPLPSKSPAPQPVQAQPVPAAPKAEVVVRKESPAVKEDDKLAAARESLRAILARAEQSMGELKAGDSDVDEAAVPLLKAPTLEALFLLNDEKRIFLHDTATPSNGARPVEPSVSDADLKRIRAQLEGGDRYQRGEKLGEKVEASSSAEASPPYNIDLRLPPME